MKKIEKRIIKPDQEVIDIKNYEEIDYLVKITGLTKEELLLKMKDYEIRSLDLTNNDKLYNLADCYDLIKDSIKRK